MEFPILYHKAKTGAIQVWKIWTDGEKIITEFGKKDGKMLTAEKICEGKNIGKKNETSPSQQADSEAQSMWQKKKDKKYSETIDATEEVRISPMLAKPFEEKRVVWPAYVQPKLDGLRCMAYKNDNGEIVLHSRGNKRYRVTHIEQQLSLVLSDDIIIDGELYIHGESLQNINSLVKKSKPGSEKIEYHIYDVAFPNSIDIDFNGRVSGILDISAGLDAEIFKSSKTKKVETIIPKLIFVETKTVNDMDQLKAAHAQFVADGYEGTIVRNKKGLYQFGFRSDDLLKYKDFEDAEFNVVGFEEGTGKFTGTPIWVCENEDGKRFNVTPTGSLDDRKKIWPNAKDYIGKSLTVRFIGRTDDNIPKFATGKGFRIEEDV